MSIGQTKLTYREYACFPDDGRRHEIIDGEHYVNPAPSTYHQTVSRRLQFLLYQPIELTGVGQVFDAPVDLHLTEHDVVQPDIVVISNDRNIITPSKIKGVPNLVIEILSPSSLKHDRELKLALYEQVGVDEYWIVDPFEQSIDRCVLSDGQYVCHAHADSVTCASVSPAVTVDQRKVW